MNINPTSSKRSCRTHSTEKQAIKDSLAPLAPFPGVLEQSDDCMSRETELKMTRQGRI